MRRGALARGARGAGLLGAALALLLGASAAAQAPDLTSMSGIPLPMTDVPAGTASVRVVRGDMAHPVVALDVTLHPTGAGQLRRLKTDSTGRATFDNLGPGEFVARATVAGRELRSQPFRAGEKSGIRMLLVVPGAPGVKAPAAPASTPASLPARGELPPGHPPIDGTGDSAGADDEHAGHDHGPGEGHAPAPPASQPSGPVTTDPGRLSLASGSELVVDFIEDAIRVTQVLRLRNDGPTFDPGPRGLTFTLPAGVVDVNVSRSGPRLTIDGKRAVILPGYVAPGETRVALQYAIAYKGPTTLEIPLPVRSDGLLVGHRPTGLSVEVAGYHQRDEVDTPQGGRFVVHRMGSLPAGSVVTVKLSHSRAVEWGAGVVVIGLLAWLLFGGRGGRSAAAARRELEERRERLLAELCALERQQRPGKEPTRKQRERRDELVAKLEQVYRELDERGQELAPGPV